MKLKQIVEAALLAAGRPLSLDQLQTLCASPGNAAAKGGGTQDASELRGEPDRKQLREVLEQLEEEYTGRGIEIREVASGFRIQVRKEYAPWVSRLYAERPPKYSRALLETLALIAYRQPITRGEIEDIRGVSVSSNIIKTLTEREWVRVVGHRDVPGKPALYATTREFLDYFNLKGLSELPTLAEIRDLESINRELELKDPDGTEPDQSASQQPTEAEAESAANQGTAREDLLEVDPDGETDSGVVYLRPRGEGVEPSHAPQQTTDADPDGETDSRLDESAFSDTPDRRSDETE